MEGRFDWGRYNFGTFRRRDVLTMGRFDCKALRRGILLTVQQEMDIRRRRSPGVLFCRLETFGLLICKIKGSICGFRQTGSGCLSTGSDFLQTRYSDSDHAECEGVFCFDSVSITFVHMASARAYVGMSCLYRPIVGYCLSVCNVGVLWPNGWMDQDATWYGSRPLSITLSALC